MTTDDNLWSIIGDEKNCRFKFKTKNKNFCTNKLNPSGVCEKTSCPLVNSKHASVFKKGKRLFLATKELEGKHRLVRNLNQDFVKWEIPLDNEQTALKFIKEKLEDFDTLAATACVNKFKLLKNYLFRKQNKQKETKVFYLSIKKKQEKKLKKYENKALRNAFLEKNTKRALLERLEQGLYENVYTFAALKTKEVVQTKVEDIEELERIKTK